MKFKRKLMAFALILSLVLTSLGSLAEGAALTLPAKLLIIDEEAFYGSAAIESVVLPEGITEIRARAFAESTLKSIDLPASLTFIADDAFENSSLKTVTAEEGTYAFDWAVRNGYIRLPMKLTLSASVDTASLGDSVTWTVQGEGGAAPLLYAFQLYHGGAVIDETDPSAATTYTKTINDAGSYYVCVTVTDKDGDTLSTTGGLVRVKGELSIEFRVSPVAALAGEQVSWSVATEAVAEPVQIAYRLYQGDDLIDSTDYADAPTYASVLASPGSYRLVALAKDANGDIAEALSDWVTVKSELALTLSANTNVAKCGSTIVWTCEGSGGTEPYLYAFKLYRGSELIQSVAPGRTRTYSHIIEEAGDYYVLATMTDADGDAIAVPSDEITVSARLTGAVTSDKALIREGETAAWTAEAINGTAPYRYDYTLLDASGETVDTASNAGAAYNHLFETAGEYTLRLTVTDAAGETAVQESATLLVIPAMSITFGETPKVGMTGKPFTWTVEGAGGIAPRRFAFQLYLDGEVVDETAFGNETEFTHTFEVTGKYTLLCLMTDADGITVQSLSDELPVTDYALSVTADADSAVPDDTVTWTATGEGGTQPYQFDFELYRNGELAETADAGDTGVYSFTFIKAGEYYVLAQMTDASGEVITAQSKTLQVLMEDLEITGLTSSESGFTIIKAYTWTAQAHGGEKPYQYQFVLSSGSTVYYTRPFSEKPTFSYTFFDSGNYTLSVQVKDALGTVTNAYQDNFSVSNRSVSVTGVVRIYVDIDPNSGQIVSGGLGHYELQINTSGGPQFAFGDRVYTNPVFSFHTEGNGSNAGIVSVFDGDRVLRNNSKLYTWSFSSSVDGLKDFLINKMQSIYLDTQNKVESEAEDAYRVKTGPFTTYSKASSNCFVAVATWANWMGNDRLSQEITNNYQDYGATNMYNKLGRYWTYVGELRG